MIKAVVTDIEGTTTSISYVKDILFPYARAHLAEYIYRHEGEPQIKQLLSDVYDEMVLVSPQAQTEGVNSEVKNEQIIVQLIRWIDEDKKVTPLKALQGLIWEDGYERGHFRGHLFHDAVVNLKSWKASGLDLYVYSSGSVHAQKLLFAHTDYGDLTPLFSGFFDTRIGGKKERDSYRKIAEQIGLPGNHMLFLSDIKEELDAARAAGFGTIWLTRDIIPDPHAEHLQVRSFDDISVKC